MKPGCLRSRSRQVKLARKHLLTEWRRHESISTRRKRIVFPLAETDVEGRKVKELGSAWMKRREAALK